MSERLKSTMILILFLIIAVVEAKKAVDPYKVLGVDKNANQREIQKAFHRLSLKYHPDKNKNKGAQEKFEEINNAYEILSDEQKRKNYDLYGDERGGSSFDGGNVGNNGGYNHFTSGGSGQNRYSFRPDEWQNMGGSGQGARSFSFSFGGPGGGKSFSSGPNDIFSNLFGGGNMGGGGGASSFGGYSGPKFGGSQFGFKSPPKLVKTVNLQVFEKEINDKGITWLLLSYTTSMSTQQYDAIFEDIANSLKGPLKVGKINCQNESSFCKKHGLHPRSTPRVFVYSYITSPSGSFVEYNGDMDVKSLKSFCQEHFPRFSKRVNLDNVQHSSIVGEKLPRVMLLSTKKDTPVIWRTLSGLLRKRFIFYDAQVSDVTDPSVKRLGVKSLPAIVGWLSNGEKQILKEGISVKDLGSAVQELRLLLEGFETKNKKIASSTEKSTRESSVKNIPLLTRSNFDVICGDETPVCLVGAFRSSKVRDKLESILLMASQKSLSRTGSSLFDSKDPISYVILDATEQQTFLKSFDKTGFGTSDGFLLAYKPRKGKYATYFEDLSIEAVERFISSVLSGDIQFKKTRQKPMIK